MDNAKRWIALTLVGALAILGAGWLLLVGPKRSEAAELRAQAAGQVAANSTLQTSIDVLKAKAKDLPKEQARLARVSAKIPDSPALPTLVRALLEASIESKVELVSITPGPPVPVAPAAPATGSPAAPAAPAGAGALASIPVAMNVVGHYFEIAQFVSTLETLPRALRVNDLTLAPGTSPTSEGEGEAAVADGHLLSATLNGFVYMSVDGPGAAPSAAASPAQVPDTSAEG